MADVHKLLLFAFYFLLLPPSFSSSPVFACDAQKSPAIATMGFCNTSKDLPERVADLMKRLTLQEKIGFLASGSNSVSRLGIPHYEWWSEALHGVSNVGPGTRFSDIVPSATAFPQVILTAASFNVSLFEAIGKAVSTEARAMYNVGLAGLTYWSPNVNIFRDPRWGRGQETPGEDPVLASSYAEWYVKGLQGRNPNKLKVAACCKHYTAYDLDNWNGVDRYRFDAVVTKQDMQDTYQPPFKSCVIDGNVASVMCSYNKVNGKPTCADSELLTGVIRGEWKLNGYIVSDCDSVDVLYNSQHYTASPEAAAAASISAGLDLNCGSFLLQYTAVAVASGLLNVSAVDNAVKNNIATLMRLGFFDGDPRSSEFGRLGPQDVCKQEHQELALDAARQGIVLLKNTEGSLPFSSRIASLAVIGPNANASKTMIGNYAGTPCKYTTLLQGLSVFAKTSFHPGCANVACGTAEVDVAKTMAASADATVLVVGADQSIEAESHDRSNILLPGQQPFLVEEVANVSKGPVILVVMSGGGMDISFAKKNKKVTSILWVGYPGEAGGTAIAEILFGKFNPGGRLPVTWYPQIYVERVPMTNLAMRADPPSGYPGRSYRFYKGETVYSFGDGLSYSEFEHQMVEEPPREVSLNLKEEHSCRVSECESVEVMDELCYGMAFDLNVRVVNKGLMKGSHSVFVFTSPPSVHNAPWKQLLGFVKVEVEGGKERVVRFSVDVCKHMSMVDEDGRRKLGLGHHVLNVGSLAHSLMILK